MSYHSVLVQVDLAHGAKARIAAAARIAAEHKASLTGVFLTSATTPSYMIGDGIVLAAEAMEAFFRERDAQNAKASDTARQMFDAAIRAVGVPGFWQDINGDSEEQIVAHARRHDLAVLPRRMKATIGGETISAEQVGMACGGPVLVLPEAGYPAAFGKRILVAWKDSRESARVLRDAWPFLSAAEEVHFVTAARDGERQLDEVLQRHLKNHGCPKARLVMDRDTDASTGEVIRRHIDMLGADMLVLGLFGHSRLQEFVLGGVSRNLLGNLTMPLLVSH